MTLTARPSVGTAYGSTVPALFTPLTLRALTLKNRIAVSPMCQYSCQDGFASDWHLVHLGSRAVGGAALVIAEATAVEARGRISPACVGIWRDEHIPPLARIVAFIHSQGAAAGLQLAHAGRKASTLPPWAGRRPLSPAEGGWEVVAPSPLPFDTGHPVPRALSVAEIGALVAAFARAAERAAEAGFDFLEVHAAHGYLIHQFNSPLTNHRDDAYGGSFANRTRFCREVVAAVRRVWPAERPLSVRLSCTDWVEGGWDLAQTVALARELKALGVDLIDCSSGGTVPYQQIVEAPGYQAPFAAAVRREAGVPTAAVGLITEPHQANAIIADGQADLVLLAREFLREPYWPLKAARALGCDVVWPVQYERAKPR